MGERAKRRTAVIAATAVLVLSMVLPVAAGALSAGAAAAPMAAHPAGTTGTSVNTGAPAVPASGGQGQIAAPPRSPHHGTLDVYEVSPGGSNTEDPSIAYDTVSYEPILNVYETLVNYDGASTSNFVPTLAVCVPDTVQCTTDYGVNLTGFVGSQPIYWTFVIDRNAHFYDPQTGNSWGVYPTDVMFSLARTLAYSGYYKDPGWIQAQALMNGALTAKNILSSMLVNDTTVGPANSHCPAAAMGHEHGCITFIADGSGTDWPFFLQLVADNLGASVEPCGWFNYEAAAMPGWHNAVAHHGDGPCMLPDGGNNTNDPAWSTYLTSGLGSHAHYWQSFENNTAHYPVVNGAVQYRMTGSGPYYAGIVPGSAYQLVASPAYQQPSGCSGSGGVATYGGYCDPAPGGYMANVNVYWETDDSFGISQYESHQADFAGIESTHTPTLLLLASEGDLNYYITPTISNFFTPINLAWSSTQFSVQFPSLTLPNIPSDFFTNLGMREFYVHSYPYTTVENTVRTVDGIQFDFNAGGPIPVGMGNYYPSNVSFPGGDPDHNPADVGGAAWWWAQITNPLSPWYDSETAACTVGTPCSWTIDGLSGDPGDDAAINDWIAEMHTISGGKLAPTLHDLTFVEDNDLTLSAYLNPLISYVGTGWAPDYPDPTDYFIPEIGQNGYFTPSDAVGNQLGTIPGLSSSASWATNNTTCGHNGTTFKNLSYWAQASDNVLGGALAGACQGVAYGFAQLYSNIAAALPVGPTRTLDYNLLEHIINGLSIFLWNGQSNTVVSAAPWIDPSSINSNVMIGGGGDQIWYQIKYAPWEQSVTFKSTGLPLGKNFTLTTGSPPTTKTASNVTAHAPAELVTGAPNGTMTFTVTPPAGYGLASVSGPHGTTYTSAPITTTTTITLKFGPLKHLYFNESISLPHWPGLPAGRSWSVTLTPTNAMGAPGMSSSTTGLSIGFVIPQGAHYKYAVSKPADFKVSGAHKGSLGMGAHATTKLVKFAVNGANIVFSEHGLAAHTSWSVSVTGPSPSLNVTTLVSTTGTDKFFLANGTYSYSIPVVGSDTPTPASGVLVVSAPHGQTIHVGFAAAHAQFGSSLVSRGSTTLATHSNLVATVSGRAVA